jgi:multiple sugar transport system ATP-binding protein
MAEIRLERISKSYDSQKSKIEAVKGIDLACRDGEFMVFLGPSGCGKTTIMRLIAGLESATSGEIFIGGKRADLRAPEKRNVALAFENYALYPPLTARENIVFPLRAARCSSGEIESRLEEVASWLELEGVLERKPAQLGGGQQQMVSLARCLIRDADVYLMDEPLSHLDSDQRFKIRTRLKAFHEETKKTIIYVTHDQMEALALADRIAVMSEGRLQQIDPPDRLYARPQNLFVAGFVGEPPMNFVPGSLFWAGPEPRFESGDKSLLLRLTPELVPSSSETAGGRRVQLGIRPEDIALAPGPGEDGFSAIVEVYESLGDEGIVELRLGQNVLTALSRSALSFQSGQTLSVSMNRQKMVFFDDQTGQRL